MSKLINVDKIDWQEEVKAIPLEKVKQAIEEIKAESYTEYIAGVDVLIVEMSDVLEILGKLIE